MQNQIETKAAEVSGAAKVDNLKRVANTRTVIVYGIPLDLGLTSKELQQWLYSQIPKSDDIQIIDVDIETGTNSVSVELASVEMVEKFKKLDGVVCLGEKIGVRRIGEETSKTSA